MRWQLKKSRKEIKNNAIFLCRVLANKQSRKRKNDLQTAWIWKRRLWVFGFSLDGKHFEQTYSYLYNLHCNYEIKERWFFLLLHVRTLSKMSGCWLKLSHFQVCFWQRSERWWWETYGSKLDSTLWGMEVQKPTWNLKPQVTNKMCYISIWTWSKVMWLAVLKW